MSAHRIDWSQVWYPGPKRAFSADEMARAGSDSPSPTLLVVAAINLASIALVVMQLVPFEQIGRVAAAMLAVVALGVAGSGWLWRRPWRRPLMQTSFAVVGAMLLLALLIRWRVPERENRAAVGLTLAVGCTLLVVLLWFLVVWRAQQIEARLREQAEREKSIEMARRLASAQMEPHFLFNTLASVQHWVQTQDARAAPLLAALTGYLRATLPLFNRPLLAAADELLAVRRYLEVMQARLGERLRFEFAVDAALDTALLPPGVLLTLVENAIVHGIEPALHGGRVRVTGRLQGGQVCFEVIDDGAGPAPGFAEGLGLSNVRERLALAFGAEAQLQLTRADAGGCRAELRLPWRRA